VILIGLVNAELCSELPYFVTETLMKEAFFYYQWNEKKELKMDPKEEEQMTSYLKVLLST